MKKVAIFDWDAHHGNGTQDIFYENDSVLVISTHRFNKGNFYPGKKGDVTFTGKGKGEGFNLNLGWNHDLITDVKLPDDEEYVYAFDRLIYPVLQEFNPDLMIVSAGFDSAKGDPLGELGVTQDGYAYMMSRLMKLAGGKVMAVLEGGYNLDVTAECAESMVRVMLGENMPTSMSVSLRDQASMQAGYELTDLTFQDVNEALVAWSKYWPNLMKDKQLLDMETKAKDSISKSRLIVKSTDFKLSDFMIKTDIFSKFIPEDQVEVLKKFQKDNPAYAMSKMDIQPEADYKSYRVAMNNLLQGIEPTAIMNIQLYPIVQDPEMWKDEEEYQQMG